MDIKLIDLSKRFDQKVIFQDLNITFLEGRMNCLMGASGIGKTTVINILMGLVEPDSGKVQGTRGKRVAAVFQEDRLIEHWNATQNIKLVCDKSISEEVIEQEFLIVGLEDNQNKPVRNFSGGMRRRVAIVRAMLAKSDLIILDEPFKGLDEILKNQVIEYVKLKAKGKTVIVVTHEKDEVQLLEANLITLQ
ncbi:MAG: ATP-binding cassette domain-containing protein [Mobilitalea sp.]